MSGQGEMDKKKEGKEKQKLRIKLENVMIRKGFWVVEREKGVAIYHFKTL